MIGLYAEIEPYEWGFLEVGGENRGNRVYWECCGNPQGKVAVVLHGGPGSGCTPWYRRLFDPGVYRIVLFDQRNCGRSTPHASEIDTSLASNTTGHLLADMEELRRHLKVERWLLFGVSWGCTLALAYAERYPERVTEMVLGGVTTGRYQEIDWLFRGGVAIFFPEQWERLRSALSVSEREGDVVEAYYRRLNNANDADLIMRQRAAEAWCLWESATPEWPPLTGLAGRFTDPVFALAFARIVTHYLYHKLFLEDGILLRNADKLANIPGILVNGRFDFQAPIANAWELKRAWGRAELMIVDNAGHAPNAELTQTLVGAIEHCASL